MNRARPRPDLPSSGMGEVRLDTAQVRAHARRVLDGADALDDVRWPADASDDLPGSAVAAATGTASLEDRVADVLAAMRAWAAVASSAAGGLQQADDGNAGRLGWWR